MSRVAAIFGGMSVEHEVSVITAQQVMAVLDGSHTVLPVYIAKTGRWYTGAPLRELRRYNDLDSLLAQCVAVTPVLDPSRATLRLTPLAARRGLFGRGDVEEVEAEIAMPLVHGARGEDGTLQGLLELAGVAYTGSGVAASALAMDKRLAKAAFRGAGLPVLDDVVIDRERWATDPAACLAGLPELGGGALFVKPVGLGSSIGVARVGGAAEVGPAVDAALLYDERCLVEAAQENIVEINCAVLGDERHHRASLLEQPVTRGLLSYDDKYRAKSGSSKGMKGSQRLVPAPLDDALSARLRAAAVAAFAAIGASGVARVDFLVDPRTDAFLVNEINPVPGSLAYYLFTPDGLDFEALLDELLAIARARQARRAATATVFEHWMLEGSGPKSSA